jgi:signal peptidase
MKKFGTLTLNIIYTIVVVAILALALLFVGTRVDLLGYEVKVVKSGSMEPAIMTGGIVVIKPSAAYNVGDVVTFGKDTRNSIPVTHRVIEKTGEGSSASYLTKGDANEDNDPQAVLARDIIGKVALTLPYVGYVIEFARTPWGFLTLIGIPALVIVLDEFANIVWEVRVYLAKRRREEELAKKKRLVARQAAKERMVLDLRHFEGRFREQKRYI